MLDTDKWINYKIKDFFDVTRGKRIVKDRDYVRAKDELNTYPVITASSINNSVDGYYYDYNCEENTVVCGGEAGGFFATFQEEKCWVMDRSRIFIPNKNFKFKMNKEIGIFLATIFRKEMFKYSYGRSPNPRHIENTVIKLPSLYNVNLDKYEPDWDGIESFMKSLWGDWLNTNVEFENINLNNKFWKPFIITDLFEVTGTKTTPLEVLENIGPGKFPYVTTQARNNGVRDHFDYWTEEGNVITMDSAVLGHTTYQEENFSASDHVEKLVPKFNMTKNIGLFIVTLLNKNKFRFSYGRKANQMQIRKLSINLPIDNQGNIDFAWIEDFINKLQYSDYI